MNPAIRLAPKIDASVRTPANVRAIIAWALMQKRARLAARLWRPWQAKESPAMRALVDAVIAWQDAEAAARAFRAAQGIRCTSHLPTVARLAEGVTRGCRVAALEALRSSEWWQLDCGCAVLDWTGAACGWHETDRSE